jgi:hypothetical protein
MHRAYLEKMVATARLSQGDSHLWRAINCTAVLNIATMKVM